MRLIRKLIVVEAVGTPGASAAAYVPMVMASRGLAFIRTLLVASLLGEVGFEFGLYQSALEFINPLVALVLFGAADVAERYVSHMERARGHTGVWKWILRQWGRILAVGTVAAGVMAAASPWIGRAVWGMPHASLVVGCAITVLFLALYQHLAAVLRGLRAYGAAAGMEVLGAMLLLVLSVGASLMHNALWLVGAYALSVLVPFAIYAGLVWRFLRRDASNTPLGSPVNDPSLDSTPSSVGAVLPSTLASPAPRLQHFGAWAFVRMMLVMLFGFLSLWGVRYVADAGGGTKGVAVAGQYAMPFRIAQLLGFLAVTMWASSYGIAARAWSHGQIRRARVQFFRVGRFGLATLTLIAVALLLTRGIFTWMLPAYADAINNLLPGLLAVFLGYALVAFFSSYADLRESPARGAALWATAVLIQIIGIVLARSGLIHVDPKEWMVTLSAAGLAIPLALVAPPLLCRPLKFSATGIPTAVLGAVPITLFCPAWVVDWIAAPVMLAAILLLYTMGVLIRPMDRRAFRRWQQRKTLTPAFPIIPTPPAP